MGSRTYETALSFEAKGRAGRTATNPPSSSLVAICRVTRDTVEFYSGDLAQFVNGRLRLHVPYHLVCWRRCSFRRMPSSRASRRSSLFDPADLDWRWDTFFENLDRDIALHLAEVKAYKSGMVELCYEVRGATSQERRQFQPTTTRGTMSQSECE